MGLIGETAGVFTFLRDFFALLPVAIRLLIIGSFGGIVYIAVLKNFGR